MVGFFIGFLVFIFVVIFIVKIIVKPSTSRIKQLEQASIPHQLGIQMEEGLPIVDSLENALSSSYVDNVKNRVLMEHPKWANHEFDWAFFELKRYFLMNSLLKSVPMFSARVDDIWHEMLMFTREYEGFSKGFYHDMLHHTPNMDSKPIPGERAFFDWVYLSLFELTNNSRVIWGDFLQNPIKREILDDFRNLSEDDLLMKYFRESEDWIEVKGNLINKMKNEINQADRVKLGKDTLDVPSSTTGPQLFNFAIGAAIFYSIYEEEQYQEHINEMIPGEVNKASQGGGSSCSGFSCSSSSDHSGGDSGGSSCSSCGGGCSS